MNIHTAWAPGDPRPVVRQLRDAGYKPVLLDHPLHDGTLPEVADPSIPSDWELFRTAERVIEGTSMIGQLPTRCVTCGFRFGGSLQEAKVITFVQRGDGNLPRPATYCPDCFEKQRGAIPAPDGDPIDREIWKLRRDRHTEADIADRVGISQSTVSRRLKRLVHKNA